MKQLFAKFLHRLGRTVNMSRVAYCGAGIAERVSALDGL